MLPLSEQANKHLEQMPPKSNSLPAALDRDRTRFGTVRRPPKKHFGLARHRLRQEQPSACAGQMQSQFGMAAHCAPDSLQAYRTPNRRAHCGDGDVFADPDAAHRSPSLASFHGCRQWAQSSRRTPTSRVLRYWDAPPWRERARAERFIAACKQMEQDGSGARLAVERAADGVFIGWCCLVKWNPDYRSANDRLLPR